MSDAAAALYALAGAVAVLALMLALHLIWMVASARRSAPRPRKARDPNAHRQDRTAGQTMTPMGGGTAHPWTPGRTSAEPAQPE